MIALNRLSQSTVDHLEQLAGPKFFGLNPVPGLTTRELLARALSRPDSREAKVVRRAWAWLSWAMDKVMDPETPAWRRENILARIMGYQRSFRPIPRDQYRLQNQQGEDILVWL